MILKTAILDDLDFIVEVYNSIIPEGEVTADLEPISVEDWTPWFHTHKSSLRPIWILWNEGVKCGWMSFKDYKNRQAYNATAEVSIYLDEKCRGKGLGHRFLRAGLDEMKQRGLKRVMSVVYASNTSSVILFEKEGFEEWGLLPGVCEVRGVEKDVVILGKKL